MQRVTYKYDFSVNKSATIHLPCYRDPDTGVEYVWCKDVRDAFKTSQKRINKDCAQSCIPYAELPAKFQFYLKEKCTPSTRLNICTVEDFITNGIRLNIVNEDALEWLRETKEMQQGKNKKRTLPPPENPPEADSQGDDILFLRSLLDGREREFHIAMRATAPENIQRAKQIVLDEIRNGKAGDLSLEQTMQEAVMKEELERKYRAEMEQYLEKERIAITKRVKKEIEWPITPEQWREQVIRWQLQKQCKFTSYAGVGFSSTLQDTENK